MSCTQCLKKAENECLGCKAHICKTHTFTEKRQCRSCLMEDQPQFRLALFHFTLAWTQTVLLFYIHLFLWVCTFALGGSLQVSVLLGDPWLAIVGFWVYTLARFNRQFRAYPDLFIIRQNFHIDIK